MNTPNPTISVVIPVYGCRAALPDLHRRLVAVLEGMGVTFEIVLVDDCCPQGSWEEIVPICKRDDRVVGIQLSRNFGQIRAITAGLDVCHGEWVVVMDCDLQDRPEGIPLLWDKAQEGYDVVFARRKERQDKSSVKFLSRSFYRVYNWLTDGYNDSSIANFSISCRSVINAYCSMRESHRAYTLFIKWLGFRQTAIDVEADARFEGESSYDFKRKAKMASDFITSQSTKPLRITATIGLVFSVVSLIYAVFLVVQTLVTGDAPVGWASLIVSLWFLGGLVLFAIGIVGIYIGNIYEEVRERPLYVVRQVLSDGSDRG